MRSNSEARAWLLAAVPVVLLAGLLVVMFVWLERNEVPQPAPTAATTPTGQPIRPAPSLTPVQPIETEPDPPLQEDLRNDDVIADQTLLGVREGFVVYGVLTGGAEVCALFRATEPGAGGPNFCVDWTVFTDQGLEYDQNGIAFHWRPDGTVKWAQP